MSRLLGTIQSRMILDYQYRQEAQEAPSRPIQGRPGSPFPSPFPPSSCFFSCRSCVSWVKSVFMVYLLLFAVAPPGPYLPLRNSDPLSPAQERLTFQMPPGFRAELAAGEPL